MEQVAMPIFQVTDAAKMPQEGLGRSMVGAEGPGDSTPGSRAAEVNARITR
jgi:hypothetical protein